MADGTSSATCAECGKPLGLNERPCPNCGSSRKSFSVIINEPAVQVSARFERVAEHTVWTNKKYLIASATAVVAGAFAGIVADLVIGDPSVGIILGLIIAAIGFVLGLRGSKLKIIDRESGDA